MHEFKFVENRDENTTSEEIRRLCTRSEDERERREKLRRCSLRPHACPPG